MINSWERYIDMLTVCLYLSTFPLLCDEFEVLRPSKVGQLPVKQYHSKQHKKKIQWTKSKEFLDTTILQFSQHPVTFRSSKKFYQPIIDLYITPKRAWRDWPWFGDPSNVFRICPKLGAQRRQRVQSFSRLQLNSQACHYACTYTVPIYQFQYVFFDFVTSRVQKMKIWLLNAV